MEKVNKLADLLLADAELVCALLQLTLGGDNILDRRATCSRARLERSLVLIETPPEGSGGPSRSWGGGGDGVGGQFRVS